MDAGTAAGVLRRFAELPNPQRVYVGAWAHGGSPNASPYAAASTAEDPPFAAQVVEDLCLLKRYLAGASGSPAGARDRGADTLAPKRLAYFTMGEERWKTTTTWPPPGVRPERWYLAAGGTLAPTPSAEAATNAVTDTGGVDRYVIDFAATTGTRNRWAMNNGAGAVDYGDRRDADRRLLTYTSAPLARDLEITGAPVLTLHAASTHTDGAFFVYLEDVAPDGTVRYLTEGQLRALHRRDAAQAGPAGDGPAPPSFRRADGRPLVPGRVTTLRVALLPVSVLVRAGHRVRIAVAGADADTFRRIPSTGTPVVTLHRSAAYPSHVVLPIVPQ
jgi:putative CocE/NonD family hydrolase